MFVNMWSFRLVLVVLVVSIPNCSTQTVSQTTSSYCNGSICVTQISSTTSGAQSTVAPYLIAKVYIEKTVPGSKDNMFYKALAILNGVVTNPDCAFRCNQNDLCVSFRVYTASKACILYKAGFEATGLAVFNKQ